MNIDIHKYIYIYIWDTGKCIHMYMYKYIHI